MATLQEIMLRAQALRQETAVDSISPERAGSIMYDTLAYINQMQLQDANPLLISKIYASVAAMEADSAPVSDLTGQPLRPGQVVVIASSDSDNGSVYRYNGGTESRWTIVGKIGNLTPVDSLDSESTQLPLAAHQGKVLDGKLTELGQEVNDIEGHVTYGLSDFISGYIRYKEPGNQASAAGGGGVYEYLKMRVYKDKPIYLRYRSYQGAGAYYRFWQFTDLNNVIVANAADTPASIDYISSAKPLVLSFAQDGYLYVNIQNDLDNTDCSFKVYLENHLYNDVKELQSETKDIEDNLHYISNHYWSEWVQSAYWRSGATQAIGNTMERVGANGFRCLRVKVYKDYPITIRAFLTQNANYYRQWYLADNDGVVLQLYTGASSDSNYISTPLILTPTQDGYLYLNTYSSHDTENAESSVLVKTPLNNWDEKDKILDARIDATNVRIDNLLGSLILLIPDVVYAIVGTELNFWNDAISLSVDRGLDSPMNYAVDWICNKGFVFERGYRFTPAAGDVGDVSCTCILYNTLSYEIVTQKTFTIRVLARNVLSTSKRTVFFGDSLGATSAIQLYANFSDTNKFLGTIPQMLGQFHSGECGYEAVGGYSWWEYATAGRPAWRINVTGVTSVALGATYKDENNHYFSVVEVNINAGTGNLRLIQSPVGYGSLVIPSGTLTKYDGGGDDTIAYTNGVQESANPLWYNNALDFAHYRTAVLGLSADQKLDAVFFQLGINGIESIAATLSEINALYDAFVADNPNGKFVVGLTTSAGNTVSGSGQNYGATNNTTDYLKRNYDRCKLYLSLLQDATRPNYRISAQRLNVDRYYGYALANGQISARYPETVKRHINYVHPDLSGYQQIADMLLAAYVGVLTE